jgi:DNA modification methylase
MGDIVASIQAVGLARSIVVDEDHLILAGNGVTEGAGEVGLEKAKYVEADGDTLVAVVRRGLTLEQKAELRVRDNQSARSATFVLEALDRAAEAAGKNLRQMGFSSEEITRMRKSAALASAEGRDETPAPEVEQAKAVAEEMGIVHGQVWKLGPHFIACGTCEDPRLVGSMIDHAAGEEILVITDPPYGVDYDQSYRIGHRQQLRQAEVVTNDDRSDWSEALKHWKGAATVAYVWYAALQVEDALANARAMDMEIRAQLVWVKPTAPMTRGHYHWQHEPLLYAVAKGKPARWSGLRDVTTVLEGAPPYLSMDEQEARSGHPTQKLIAHFVGLAGNHTHAVLGDPFAGSGTTLLAAHRLERKALLIELEPHWVALALTRGIAEMERAHEPEQVETFECACPDCAPG